MKKTTPLKIVNVFLGLAFITQAVTGLLLSFTLGPFSTLAAIHQYTGYAFIVLAASHIFLNRVWIRANYLKFLAGPKPAAIAKTVANPAATRQP